MDINWLILTNGRIVKDEASDWLDLTNIVSKIDQYEPTKILTKKKTAS
jgi:hypothetical protein